MSTIRFTCSQLINSGKKGILKPVSDGYYDVVIGGLNIYNSAGMKYTAVKEVIDLFESSSSFQRKVKRGALRGEVGHPKMLPGMTEEQYIDRILSIDEKNVCVHFSEIYLDFENFKNEDGSSIVAIRAIAGPSGPKGDFLDRQFKNPRENVCFSIRSFTEDYYKGGVVHRDIKNIITFDYVNEPGIHIAEKFKHPSLEDLKTVKLQKKNFDNYFKRETLKLGNESQLLTKAELYKSFGWVEKKEKPLHANW